MVRTEYSYKLILKYFLSAVDESQNGDFGLHAFGSFIKPTPHRAAAPGEFFFVYTTYRKFVYVYTTPGLDSPLATPPSWIKPRRRLWQSPMRHDSCRWKNPSEKRIPGQKHSRQNCLPLKTIPPGMVLSGFGFWSKRPATGLGEKRVSSIEIREIGDKVVGVNLFSLFVLSLCINVHFVYLLRYTF